MPGQSLVPDVEGKDGVNRSASEPVVVGDDDEPFRVFYCWLVDWEAGYFVGVVFDPSSPVSAESFPFRPAFVKGYLVAGIPGWPVAFGFGLWPCREDGESGNDEALPAGSADGLGLPVWGDHFVGEDSDSHDCPLGGVFLAE